MSTGYYRDNTATYEQRLAIKALERLVKKWPAGSILFYHHFTKMLVVTDEEKNVLAEIPSKNLNVGLIGTEEETKTPPGPVALQRGK